MPALRERSEALGCSMPPNSQIVIYSSTAKCHNLCRDVQGQLSHIVSMSDAEKMIGPNHLRAWRRFRGLSLEELAELVDTAPNMIGYLEQGKRQLSLKWLYRLAPALKINAGWLIDHDPNNLPPDLIEIWSNADDRQRIQISEIAATIVRNGTNG